MFALVVIGAIVAGNFFAGRLEQRSAQNMFFAGQAAEAAETGLSDAIVTTPAATLEALAVGGPPLDLGAIIPGSGVTASRQVSRLTGNLFLFRALGTRQDAAEAPLATRAIGLIVTLVTDTLGRSAAVPLAERAWVQLH
jgi:hypothetical protein